MDGAGGLARTAAACTVGSTLMIMRRANHLDAEAGKDTGMSTATQTGPERRGRWSDEDVETARHQVARAFSLLGLVENGRPTCPSCGTSRKGKVTLREDRGYWKCFKCSEWGSPIKLMEASGWKFTDAVGALLGQTVPGGPTAKLPEVTTVSSFRSDVDPEVYATVVAAGDPEAAAAYYARWHIAPQAVRQAGAVRITGGQELQKQLAAQYGRARLIRAGLVKPAEETDTGIDTWLLTDRYPVVEVHKDPDGTVVGMQFRPDGEQLRKVEAHIRDGGPYVPKFLSLRGGGPDSLVGCGLDLIQAAEPGQPVYIVEGYKDMLAVMTMGGAAYAIPGAGATIPKVALDVLGRHPLILALDADPAGAAGTERTLKTLTDAGIRQVTVKKDMPEGMDPTDVLVARYARTGCQCQECVRVRGGSS